MKRSTIKMAIIMSSLFLFVSCENRKDMMMEEFLNKQFIQYAGEAYLQQYEDEDIAKLEKMLNDKIINPGSGFYQTIEGLGMEQSEAFGLWANEVCHFKVCYDVVLKRCYKEKKHKDDVPQIDVSSLDYVVLSDYPTEITSDLYLNECAYCVALNTIQKLPNITVTDKKEINDTTWQVTTNSDKNFIVTFSNLDNEEAKVEISCEGKVIAKNIYLVVADYNKCNYDISFDGEVINTDLAKVKDVLEQLGYVTNGREDNAIDYVYYDMHYYTGNYYGYENSEVEIHCWPNDANKVWGIEVKIDRNANVGNLVKDLSSTYGECVYQEVTSETSEMKRGRYSWIYPNFTINIIEGVNCVMVSYLFF